MFLFSLSLFLSFIKIFAICALYTTWNFDINVTIHGTTAKQFTFDYPFKFGEKVCTDPGNSNRSAVLSADVSSDARFFVATSVLSILYSLFISAVYAAIDEIYTSKPEVPLAVSASVCSCVLYKLSNFGSIGLFSSRTSY